MRIVVLANCASGVGAEEGARRAAISAAFQPTGMDPDVRCVLGGEMQQAARDAARGRPDVVVAAGGDGSVSAVAGALAGTRVAMAVLPFGTLNHFARDAGIPADLEQAAALAVDGKAGPVDVAEVNGHVFVNNSSIGVYPRAVRERRRLRAQGAPSKRWATLQAAWTVLQRLPAHEVLLTIDGRPVFRTTSFVFVGNNSYETGFGRLGRRASLTAGHLGVYHAVRPGRRAVLALAARAFAGR
ncbi:MAG: hypothetical protein LC620_06255, partial [Halobacteriales archaeon]|nr:hypothetical protein [Halobacteriales archaeon]